VDIDRNEIMWQLNPHEQRAPASTTKMIAVMVGLANFPLDKEVVIPESSTRVSTVETRMAFLPGERLTIRELLTGMMVISANDASLALAEGTVGMDNFVEAMNQQVADLGLRNSRFTGPVGYPDDPAHFSSAYDLAVVATAGTRAFPLFAELGATRDAYLPPSPAHHEFVMHNINRLLETYPAAVGTKSGYTDAAGPCLVSMAVRDGHRLVAVLLNSPRLFDQSRALLEWGFVREGLPAMYPPPPPPAPPAPPRRPIPLTPKR
jgi:D-alanyl-D-alanine carboxypeptidase (penicillin-binding protein 5/6)